jgi:Flp pilus assembly protein TadG
MSPAFTSRQSRRPQPNRGAVAVLAAFLLVMLLAMVAFAVDLGYIAHAQTELQRSADAAALAAASQLPDQAAAIAAAVATSRDNQTGVAPPIDPADIEFGFWNRDTVTFGDSALGGSPSAVRVTIRRTAAGGNALNLFFGQLLGRKRADVTATATASKDHGLCGAFIGIASVGASGNIQSDSFDSRVGPYSSDTAGDHGGLCSDGPITLNGGDYIRGDVRAGRDAQVKINGDSAVVTGNIGNRVKPLNLPAVDASVAAAHNDNSLLPALATADKGKGKGKGSKVGGNSPLDSQRNFKLDGTTEYTIPPGTYYFSDMELSGQSILNFTGPTVIYLTGELKRAGGTVVNNNTQIAANLKIYSSGGDIDITSDNNFYGVIYAPLSDVIVGGTADYFGAIVGQTLQIKGDAQTHYDEALQLGEIDLPTRVTLVD